MNTKTLILFWLAAFASLGCHKDDFPGKQQYSLYILGRLDRTYVSMQVNGKSIAGGFLSSEQPLELAFELPFTATPGDSLEIGVNLHTDSPFNASFVLPDANKRHILASIQTDSVLFEAKEVAPTFK